MPLVRGALRLDLDAIETAPGDFAFAASDEGLFFICPCGCGREGYLPLGEEDRPRWQWDGNREAPTLVPSILQLACRWHGWLRAGVWEPC